MPIAVYENQPLSLPRKEQEDASLKWEDEPRLVFDDDDDFEIPAEPPDDGSWVDVLLACPYPLEIPPRSRHCTPPLEL